MQAGDAAAAAWLFVEAHRASQDGAMSVIAEKLPLFRRKDVFCVCFNPILGGWAHEGSAAASVRAAQAARSRKHRS